MEKLFHNILHQPVAYPPFLSEQAKSLLEAVRAVVHGACRAGESTMLTRQGGPAP
jgi:hypothetical protein